MSSRKVFAVLVVALFLYVASPLLFPIIMGAVLAVLIFPVFTRLEKWKVPTALSSALLTLGVTLLFLLPTTLLLFLIAKSGFQQLQFLREAPRSGGFTESFLGLPAVHGFLERMADWFPIEKQELLDAAQDLVRSTGLKLADFMGGIAARLPSTAMALAVIIVSIYFFLVDGRKLAQFFRKNSFFTPAQTQYLMTSLQGICRSVILASVASGLVQAILEMGMCLALGVPNILLIGGLVFVGSFIPLVGSAPATLGVAAHQFIVGNSKAGTILLVTAAVVAALDNLIRPVFLKGRANLHPLMGFVAAFGGLQMLGVLGVFLGPIVAALFVATLHVVLEEEGERSTPHQ